MVARGMQDDFNFAPAIIADDVDVGNFWGE
jgi:hypothetical protein